MKRTKKSTKITRTKSVAKKIRTKKSTDEQFYICEMVLKNDCWYKGPCPHRTPHKTVKIKKRNMCENGFCSLMKLTTGCVPVK